MAHSSFSPLDHHESPVLGWAMQAAVLGVLDVVEVVELVEASVGAILYLSLATEIGETDVCLHHWKYCKLVYQKLMLHVKLIHAAQLSFVCLHARPDFSQGSKRGYVDISRTGIHQCLPYLS